MAGRETKGGLVQVTLTLDPDDLARLRAEAVRRAKARKSARPDASELVREAVADWLAKQGRKPHSPPGT